MKKIVVLTLVLTMLFTTSTFAVSRAATVSTKISFSGNTTNCRSTIFENSKSIKATMKLYEGSTLVSTWSKSGTSTVILTGSHAAKSGKTYKLVVNYTINGGSTQTVSTTKTCP